jgi:hypothetical protein
VIERRQYLRFTLESREPPFQSLGLQCKRWEHLERDVAG